MSYIRCLGNPERLYIWVDTSGPIAIHTGRMKDALFIPKRVFLNLMQRFFKDHYNDEPIKFGGAILQPAPYKRPKYVMGHPHKVSYDKWRLTWKEWPEGVSVDAYEVTWFYVAHNVVEEETRKRRSAIGREGARARTASQRDHAHKQRRM